MTQQRLQTYTTYILVQEVKLSPTGLVFPNFGFTGIVPGQEHDGILLQFGPALKQVQKLFHVLLLKLAEAAPISTLAFAAQQTADPVLISTLLPV